MLQEGVGPALGDEDKAIMLVAERVLVLEIVPKVAKGLPAILVRSTHAKTALDLAGKPADASVSTFTVNQEVVSLPAQPLCLEVNLHHCAVNQDRWNALD